jgi:hypothetical protein
MRNLRDVVLRASDVSGVPAVSKLATETGSITRAEAPRWLVKCIRASVVAS